MNVAIYARVSTDEQAERYGLSSQLTELRAAVAARGLEAAAEFVDDGYTGTLLHRPALTRLRAAVRSGSVGLVVIYDPDRLARKLVHQLLVMRSSNGPARASSS